jgi:hypothetical protein
LNPEKNSKRSFPLTSAAMASPSGPAAIDASLIERVLIHGDLRQLTPAQKVSYYNAVCQSVGLNGRTDVSTGAVSIANVNGEARANAMMKAETKAKRRVTLSICGLGMLDETEVESIPEAVIQLREPPTAAAVPVVASDDGLDLGVDLPPGTVRVTAIGPGKAGAKGEITFSDGQSYLTWEQEAVRTAMHALEARTPVTVEFKRSTSGNTRVHSLTPVVF